MKKGMKGLGRGLGALLPEDVLTPETPEQQPTDDGRVYFIPLRQIDPTQDQPRRNFDPQALESLAASMAVHGVLQPIIVQPTGERYRIIAGERRWRAAKIAGLKEIPALVRNFDPRQQLEVTLIENLQRKDLNPVEEAAGIQAYINQFSLTQEEAAQRLGRSRPALANTLRLLQLPDEILVLIQEGSLSAGHARALVALEDAKTQLQMAQLIVEKGLSVRQTEKLVAQHKSERAKQKTRPADPEALNPLADLMRETMGTKVKITGTLQRGKIQLDYYSREDLDRIWELMERLKG